MRPIQTFLVLRNSRVSRDRISRKSEFNIDYIRSNIRIKCSPSEIQTPTPWKVIGYSITAQAPVLSSSSILLPLSSHCSFIPAAKIQRALKFIFDYFAMKCLLTCVRYYTGNRRFGWPISGLNVILWSLYFKMMKIHNNCSVFPHV